MSVDVALRAFLNGQLVGIPTETVYGLAAPVSNIELVKRIFEVKERPFFDPLIVHVSDIEMAKRYVSSWPSSAQKLAERFWPGPLTLILPKLPDVDNIITSGLNTVGLRAPNNPITLQLIRELKEGLAAPSANKFTKTSPTRAEHVRESFNEKDVFVLDSGPCEVGIESTIVDLTRTNITILRPGIITKEMIEKVTGEVAVLLSNEDFKIKAPGQMKIHYTPEVPLVVAIEKNHENVLEEVQAKLDVDNFNFKRIKLSVQPELAARELYGLLRTPLEGKTYYLLEIPFPIDEPLWEGVKDRLKKAATLFIS